MFNLHPTLIDINEETRFLLEEKARSINYSPKCAICRSRIKEQYMLHMIGHNYGFDIKPGIYVTHHKCGEKAKRIAYRQSDDPYAIICGLIHMSGVNPV